MRRQILLVPGSQPRRAIPSPWASMPAVPGPHREPQPRGDSSTPRAGHFPPRSGPAASHYCTGGLFVQPGDLGVPSVSHFLLFCSEKSCHSLEQDVTFLQDYFLRPFSQGKKAGILSFIFTKPLIGLFIKLDFIISSVGVGVQPYLIQNTSFKGFFLITKCSVARRLVT